MESLRFLMTLYEDFTGTILATTEIVIIPHVTVLNNLTDMCAKPKDPPLTKAPPPMVKMCKKFVAFGLYLSRADQPEPFRLLLVPSLWFWYDLILFLGLVHHNVSQSTSVKTALWQLFSQQSLLVTVNGAVFEGTVSEHNIKSNIVGSSLLLFD